MKFYKIDSKKAQAAVEYMLILAVVVSIVLVGFRIYIQRSHDASDLFFNNIAVGIMGKPNRCGDNQCDAPWEDFNRCCYDCGGCSTVNGGP